MEKPLFRGLHNHHFTGIQTLMRSYGKKIRSGHGGRLVDISRDSGQLEQVADALSSTVDTKHVLRVHRHAIPYASHVRERGESSWKPNDTFAIGHIFLDLSSLVWSKGGDWEVSRCIRQAC